VNFARVLEEVASQLDALGARWGIAGAFALHAYGFTRATADLDFVAERGARAAIVPFLQSLGYETLHASEGFSNHVHPLATLGRVDFVYVDEQTATRLFERAARVELFPGRFVLVPRPEHLAAMKVLAMKNDPSRTFRELADIQQLLTLPGIDVDVVRRAFEQHGLTERFHELQRLTRAT
jgi:hypothetical protein